jgi:polyferredoxin
MEKSASRESAERQRRMIQILFVLVNVLLIEVRMPGWLWLGIGAVFWATMLMLAAVGGNWMCGWICWLGTAQDIAEPLARQRFRPNAFWTRTLILALLILWVPVGWYLMPAASTDLQSPFGLNAAAWQSRLFQIGLLVVVGLSVTLLGKRGLCRFLCPFIPMASALRSVLPRRDRHATVSTQGCVECHVATTPPTNTLIRIESIEITSSEAPAPGHKTL